MAYAKKDERTKVFVREFIVDFNGVRAARESGYKGTDKSLAVQASRLLRDPAVQKELQVALTERKRRTNIEGDMVVLELARLGFSDLTDVATWDEEGKVKLKPSHEIPKRIRRAIKEITTKVTRYGIDDDVVETTVTTVKLHDKVKPLELLLDHTGVRKPKPDADNDENREQIVVVLPDNGRGSADQED